jgi:FtsZ-binding cell division protein ZapB
MIEVDFIGLTFEELSQLKPLLSHSSYENIKKEFKRLEKCPPPLKGSGVYNHQYIPANEKEYREQNQILRNRLEWQRRCFALLGIQNDFLSKDNRQLQKANDSLKQQNERLSKENERLKIQLRKILGKDKDNRKSKDKDNSESPGATGTDGQEDQRKKKKRGAPKGHRGATRPIPTEVDFLKEIPPPCLCDQCGHDDISQTSAFVSKYIEDIPPVVKQVTEIRYMEGICERCHSSVIHPSALVGPPVTIGPNLTALLTGMRQQMGATYRKMSRFSTEALQIALSPSGVLGIINRMGYKMEPIYKAIEAALPLQEVLHGDETGWKMDGANWYLWCFCNRHMVYFHASESRGSKVPKSILGEDFQGILHADFYAAYNFVAKTQRCLIHFQGDINDELVVSPGDYALIQLKQGIQTIIDKAKRIKQLTLAITTPASTTSMPALATPAAPAPVPALAPDPPKLPLVEVGEDREKEKKEMDDILLRLSQLDSPNQKTEAFIKRIIKHRENMLRFMDHPEAEYHNNRAERAIRPSVISRKISFGNRTEEGAYLYAILASVIETYRLKNQNINDFLLKIYHYESNKKNGIIRALLDTS